MLHEERCVFPGRHVVLNGLRCPDDVVRGEVPGMRSELRFLRCSCYACVVFRGGGDVDATRGAAISAAVPMNFAAGASV